MKIKRTLSILLLIIIAVSGQYVSAAENVKPGIKPDSFFYVFDNALERVGLFLTIGAKNKGERALSYAEEKLSEAESLYDGDEGKDNEDAVKAADLALEKYVERMDYAVREVEGLDGNKKAELLADISERAVRHERVLSEVLQKVPEQAQPAIVKAMEVSRRGQKAAAEHAAQIKEEIKRLSAEVRDLSNKNKEK